jgi:hypothetical protein
MIIFKGDVLIMEKSAKELKKLLITTSRTALIYER